MSKLEFVEYTGRYPNLCSGRLFVRIDGKLFSFGNYCRGKKGKTSDDGVPNYPKFWTSGGHIWGDDKGNMGSVDAPWRLEIREFDEPEFPVDIKELLPQLIELFNDNVEPGCCGGCI